MLATLACLAALAAPAPAATLTMHQALDAAERSSPEIAAAKARWEALRARVGQAWAPAQPRLDLERMYAPPGRSPLTGADEKSYAVTQELPFPTTLVLRRSAAAQAAAAAEQDYLAKAREVSARARATYAMLYLAQVGLEIYEENIDLMRRFAKAAESKYAAGRASQGDALKAQVELTKMLNMHVIHHQERESAEAMLAALMGRDAREPLGPVAEPSLTGLERPDDELEAYALAGRPELQAARRAAERAGTGVALARSEFLPELMLQFRRRSDPMRGKTSDAVLGLSLPLWLWKPAGMLAEAKAERAMAQAEAESARLMTLAELRDALVRAKTARRLAETYRSSVLPQGEAALKTAEANYQSDRSSFLDLLDAQRTLLNFRLEYHEYLAGFQSRLADVERVVGRRLTP